MTRNHSLAGRSLGGKYYFRETELDGGREDTKSSTALHWAARTLCRQADQGVATLAQAAATHVASEHTRGFRIVACLQNCHHKTCVCSSTCAQDLCWWCRVIAAAGSWSHITRQAAGVHGIQGDEWSSALNDCFYFVDIMW